MKTNSIKIIISLIDFINNSTQLDLDKAVWKNVLCSKWISPLCSVIVLVYDNNGYIDTRALLEPNII